MTDEEMEDSTAVYYLGFEKGRHHERNSIVDWLRANLKGNTDPWSKAADAIEAREHLK